MILFPIWLTYAYINQIGARPITLPALIIVLAIILISLLLFIMMTTTVYDNRVEVKYGFSIIKRVFLFSELNNLKIKKIPCYYGAGIKYYTNGTLYSINFTDAVEFRYKQRNISIGSKNPELLLKSLKQYQCVRS